MPCCHCCSQGVLRLAKAGIAILGSFILSQPAQAAVESFRFESSERVLRIEIWDNDLVHVEISSRSHATPDGQPIWTSPMVSKRSYPGPDYARRIEINGRKGIETPDIRVLFDSGLKCVETLDRVRDVTLQTLCPKDLGKDWKSLEIHAPRTRNLYGLGQYFVNPGTADGDLRGRVLEPGPMGNELRGFSGGANSVSMFPVVYLLGEGTEGHAILLDQVYRQRWDFASKPWKAEMWGDQIRWFVFSGADAKDLRSDLLELTGRPPVPPKSAMGLWVSEFGYDNWSEIKHQVELLDRHAFPIDGFALDIQWFGGSFFSPGDDTRNSRFGTLEFDEQRFPRPKEEIRALKNRGIELMPIEESYVSFFLDEHRRLWERGYLANNCGTQDSTFLTANPWWGVGGMIDWTNPEAGDFWHDLKRQPLIDLGLTHHWTDLGEPEMYSTGSCYYGFPEIGKNRHGDIHNVFNLSWLESIARGYRRNGVRKRPFLMSRSGIVGVQRTGAGMWSGDIAANMGALTAHLNAQMHMSFSGVDYYGADVGGFHRRPDTLDGDANELYTQWFANASLFDFPLRSHVWNLSNTLQTSPAAMGDRKSNLANVRRRYELLPYLYSLAHRANVAGEPIIAPLVMEFQSDPKVRSMGNEKMIGPSLLAPVIARYGELHRGVYLPAGEWALFDGGEWFDSKGETFDGIPARRDGVIKLPLFARAGAIVPLARVDESTRNIHGLTREGKIRRDLRIRIYGSAQETEFALTEDDGKTIDYTEGRLARTIITQKLEGSGSLQRVRISGTNGEYEGKPGRRDLSVELFARGKRATGVRLNGALVNQCPAGGDCWKNSENGMIEIRMPRAEASQSSELEISLQTTPPRTTAYFACHGGTTNPGVSVYVSGNIEALGSWDPARAIKLDPAAYPVWTGAIQGLPVNASIRWKCLRRPEKTASGGGLEYGIERSFRTREAGYSGAQEGHFQN